MDYLAYIKKQADLISELSDDLCSARRTLADLLTDNADLKAKCDQLATELQARA